MSTNQLNSKRLLLLLISLMTLVTTKASETCDNDSVVAAVSAYQQRIRHREEVWRKIIPNLSVIQYAGDIGMISAGTGWDYGKSNQWETHLMFGYLPPKYKNKHYWTFTLRQMYYPWRINIGDSWSVNPLSVSGCQFYTPQRLLGLTARQVLQRLLCDFNKNEISSWIGATLYL